MRQITIPSPLFREEVRTLLRARPGTWAVRTGGLRWTADGVAEMCAAGAVPGDRHGMGLRVVERLSPEPPTDGPVDAAGLLEIGRAAAEGQARGWLRGDDGLWQPADRLFLPGPRLASIALTSALSAAPGDPPADDRHSRTIGALGADTYDRLARLRIGLVGLGRLGSILARSLIDFGVRGVALVDPDVVELHNLGEGGFFDEATLHLPKAEAWENWLALHFPEVEVEAVVRSITHRAALDALARCDVLVSAPDHSAPRLVAGLLAAALHRPLLDVGTQVHRPGGPATMGADVRLILPGAPDAPGGCLLCAGGVADETAARRALASPDDERRLMEGRVWHEERPGSLHSLNLFAASLALRMLEDCAAGRIGQTTWCRAEFAPDGTASVRHLQPAQAATECFCAFAGWGDAAFARLGPLLTRRAARVAVGMPA